MVVWILGFYFVCEYVWYIVLIEVCDVDWGEIEICKIFKNWWFVNMLNMDWCIIKY